GPGPGSTGPLIRAGGRASCSTGRWSCSSSATCRGWGWPEARRTRRERGEDAMTHQPLRGQTALVTGASSGIGEAVARALGAAGADVVVNYIVNPVVAERVAAEIRAGGVKALAIRADVSRE